MSKCWAELKLQYTLGFMNTIFGALYSCSPFECHKDNLHVNSAIIPPHWVYGGSSILQAGAFLRVGV